MVIVPHLITRSLPHLVAIAGTLHHRGARLGALRHGDTSLAQGNFLLKIHGAEAEFERAFTGLAAKDGSAARSQGPLISSSQL